MHIDVVRKEGRLLRVTALVLNYGNDQIFGCSRGEAALRSFTAWKSVDRRWRSEKIEGFSKKEIPKFEIKNWQKLGNIIEILNLEISFQFSNRFVTKFQKKNKFQDLLHILNWENQETTIFKEITRATRVPISRIHAIKFREMLLSK